MSDCLVYFVLFAFVFLINFAAIKQKKPVVRKILILLSFLVLLIFIGFRYNVGTDYQSYLEEYTVSANTEWTKIPSLRIEPLMAIVFKLSSYILHDPRLIFVIVGFLSLYPVYKLNKLYDYRYLPYSVLAYCVLFLPFGLNGMRQGIAMGFTSLSIVYFARGSIKHGIIDFVVSVLFHTSAAIVLPYIIAICLKRWKKFNFNKMSVIITILVGVVVLFFLNNFLIENGINKYNYILGKIDLESMSITRSLFYLPILLMVVFLRNKDKKDDEISIMRNLVIVGLVFYLFGSSARYLSRFALYFMMLAIIVLPELIQNIPKRNLKMLCFAGFVVYLVVLFYLQYAVLGWQEILPYRTWLFGGI